MTNGSSGTKKSQENLHKIAKPSAKLVSHGMRWSWDFIHRQKQYPVRSPVEAAGKSGETAELYVITSGERLHMAAASRAAPSP